MKKLLLILGMSLGLAGCLSKIEPNYEARHAIYKEAMLNGEVLGSDGKVHTVKYKGNIYTCYSSTGLCNIQ